MTKPLRPISEQFAGLLHDSLRDLAERASYRMIDNLPVLAEMMQPATLPCGVGFTEMDVRLAANSPALSREMKADAEKMYALLGAVIDARAHPEEPDAYGKSLRSLGSLRHEMEKKNHANGLYGLLVKDMDIGRAIATSSTPITPEEASLLLHMETGTRQLQ